MGNHNSWHIKVSYFNIVVYLIDLCLPQDGSEDAAPVRVLMKADPSSRESLQTEAEVDPMDGEQTWPTESELLEAEGAETDISHENILRWDKWQDEAQMLFFLELSSQSDIRSRHSKWNYLHTSLHLLYLTKIIFFAI